MNASRRAQLTVNGRIGSCGTATDARRDEWEAANTLHDCTTWPMEGIHHVNHAVRIFANYFSLTHLTKRRHMQQLAGVRRGGRASGSQRSTYQRVEHTFSCLSNCGWIVEYDHVK